MRNLEEWKRKPGITLIALVITIIVLLILAGVSLNLMAGSDGILGKAMSSVDKTEKARIKEEIEMAIVTIQMGEMEKGKAVTLDTLADGKLESELDEIEVNLEVDEIIGEYKNYEYTIDKNLKVEIGEKVTGIKPNVTIEKSKKEYTFQPIQIKLNVNIAEGNITEIIAPEGAELITDLSNTEKTYQVSKNGTYIFDVKADNGTSRKKTVKVDNILEIPKIDIQDVTLSSFKIQVDNNYPEGAIVEYQYYVGDAIKKQGTTAQSYKVDGLTEETVYDNIKVVAFTSTEEQVSNIEKTKTTRNLNEMNRKSCTADGDDGHNIPENAVDGNMTNGNGYNWYEGTRLLVEYKSLSTIESVAVYTTDNWGYSFTQATIYYSEDDSLSLDSDLSQFKSIVVGTEKEVKLAEDIKAKRVMLVKTNVQAVYEFKCFGFIGVKQITVLESMESMEKVAEKIANSGEVHAGILTQEENVMHKIEAIVYNGDLVLNGTDEIEGAQLNDKTYEFGDTRTCVGQENIDAQKTVLLKVNGDLTINEGVMLTTCKSKEGYGGPKGLIIYCTGTIMNHGEISMTARGAKAEGQNVYLLKNGDGTYEYVPSKGAEGGAISSAYAPDRSTVTNPGNAGENADARRTGGGGSGMVTVSGYTGSNTWNSWNQGQSASSGAGTNGTSYSGGTGGGAGIVGLTVMGGTYTTTGANGETGILNGGAGGKGGIGGTGNPGGVPNGTNGTGGLLVIYTKGLNNKGKITSNGTDSNENAGASGGGSINIFYRTTIEQGEITAMGGNGGNGGNGGDGCVTIIKND